MNIFKKVKNKIIAVSSAFAGIGNISQKLFWLTSIYAEFALITIFLVKLYEQTSWVLLGTLILLLFLNPLNMFLTHRRKDYDESYTVNVLVFVLVLLPICFCASGGFRSGSVIYWVLPMVMGAVNGNKKRRVVLCSISVLTYFTLFALAVSVPEMSAFLDSRAAVLGQEKLNVDIIAAVILTTVSSSILVSSVLNAYENAEKINIREREKRSEIQIDLLEAQISNMEDVKRIRHDVRHHNALIVEYAQNGDIDGLIAYMQQKQKADEYYARKIYCMNQVINNIISVYVRKAEKSGIRMDVDADVRNDINASSSDLVTVIANILENAIHGAEKSDNEYKFISIALHEKANKLILSCRNPCRSDVVVVEGRIGNPGTGVTSVMKVIEETGGLVEYSMADDMITCTVLMELG